MSRAPPTKPAHLQSACSTAVPACHRPRGEGEALASAAVFSLRFKRHTQGGATPNTSKLSAQSTKIPSASDGQCQIDGNHTLSFRIFMRTSNLNFQVHMTISKSDKQCSQTVHL